MEGTVKLGRWKQFRRFLITGAISSFYTPCNPKSEHAVLKCVQELQKEGKEHEMIQEIVDVLTSGKVYKYSFGLQALAKVVQCAPHMRSFVLWNVMPKVCPTIRELMEFLSYLPRSWGRSTRRAVEKWLFSFSAHEIAYQMSKYKNHAGFSVHDILRLAHPNPERGGAEFHELFAYVCDKWGSESLRQSSLAFHKYLEDIELARHTTLPCIATEVIRKHNLSWEHIGHAPLLKEASVWHVLMEKMNIVDILHNLHRILQAPNLDTTYLCERLGDAVQIHHHQLQPLEVLETLRGVEHDLSVVSKEVHAALSNAFQSSFDHLQPTLLKYMLAIDVSGSMRCSPCIGSTNLTARDAAAALTTCFLSCEPFVRVTAFSDVLRTLPLNQGDSFEKVLDSMSHLSFDDTDITLPITYALEHNINVDCFVVITDAEAGSEGTRPAELLGKYRKFINPYAKLVVVATSIQTVCVAEPWDRSMLDIAGIDSHVFSLIQDFATGRV